MECLPWYEKYRPKTLESVILDKVNERFFKNICEMRTFPHLVFHGPAGTGKTTTILALVRDFEPHRKKEVLHLNASDERGIEVIRTQISNFVRSNAFFANAIKVVILDEVDHLTKSAQYGLSYLIQALCYQSLMFHDPRYHRGSSPRRKGPMVRFCLICNYISKIVPSLKHEFISVRFNMLPKNRISSLMSDIARRENIVASRQAISGLYTRYGSDVRAMINHLQTQMQISESASETVANESKGGRRHGCKLSPLSLGDHVQMLFDTRCFPGSCAAQMCMKYTYDISSVARCSRKEVMREYISVFLSRRLNASDIESQTETLSKSLTISELALHMSDDSYLDDVLFGCFSQLQCNGACHVAL
jgi:DNA polymerase III delta prime subunit